MWHGIYPTMTQKYNAYNNKTLKTFGNIGKSGSTPFKMMVNQCKQSWVFWVINKSACHTSLTMHAMSWKAKNGNIRVLNKAVADLLLFWGNPDRGVTLVVFLCPVTVTELETVFHYSGCLIRLLRLCSEVLFRPPSPAIGCQADLYILLLYFLSFFFCHRNL